MTFKLAAIQMSSKENKRNNLEKAVKYIKLAVENGALLMALPELFATPWFPSEIREKNFSLAEKCDGEIVSTMKDLSKQFNIVICVPFFEKYRKRFYNSCAVLDKGKLLGVYRKVHIPNIPLYEEKYYFSAGNRFPVFETSLCKLGVQICWDNFFWEGYRSLAIQGAEIIVSPTASSLNTQKRWKVVLASQALLNNVFILRVNRVGKEKHQEFYGNSFLVAPDGSFVSDPMNSSEGIYFANCDLKEVVRIRKLFHFLDGRRPELYKSLIEKKVL